MNCMKCGREMAAGQVFCEECLAEMARYPVHPGTVVQLPHRTETPVHRKTVKRRTISTEETIRGLRKQIRILLTVLLVCFMLIGLMIYPTYEYLSSKHLQIGQNYTVAVSQSEDDQVQNPGD